MHSISFMVSVIFAWYGSLPKTQQNKWRKISHVVISHTLLLCIPFVFCVGFSSKGKNTTPLCLYSSAASRVLFSSALISTPPPWANDECSPRLVASMPTFWWSAVIPSCGMGCHWYQSNKSPGSWTHTGTATWTTICEPLHMKYLCENDTWERKITALSKQFPQIIEVLKSFPNSVT